MDAPSGNDVEDDHDGDDGGDDCDDGDGDDDIIIMMIMILRMPRVMDASMRKHWTKGKRRR